MRRRRAAVQRPAPMFSPARWITASSPSSAPASIRPASGSQVISPGASGGRRTSRTTSCPPVCRNRRERAADQPGRARDQHAERLRRSGCVAVQVAAQPFVTKSKDAFQPLSPPSAARERREAARLILDPVGELAARRSGRLEQVAVVPRAAGAFELPVLERLAGPVTLVLQRPARAERADAHAQRDAVAVADRPRALDRLDPFLRREQPIQRARALVPGEGALGEWGSAVDRSSRSPWEQATVTQPGGPPRGEHRPAG